MIEIVEFMSVCWDMRMGGDQVTESRGKDDCSHPQITTQNSQVYIRIIYKYRYTKNLVKHVFSKLLACDRN